MNHPPLTDRQAMIHAHLCERWNDPPSMRELAAHFGIALNAMNCHVKALARKGYIELPEGARSRGIKLLLGPDLSGTEIEIAGRMYRLTSTTTEGANGKAGSVSKGR